MAASCRYMRGYCNAGRSALSKQKSNLSFECCSLNRKCTGFFAGFQGQLMPSVAITLEIHQSCPQLRQLTGQARCLQVTLSAYLG